MALRSDNLSTRNPSLEGFRGTERFRVQRCLGKGAFGLVYLADDLKRGGCVALKVLRRMDHGALYRFKQEFRSLADLQHPNLVKLHELMSDGEEWFFTMEMIEGVDFLQYVSAANLPRPSGPEDSTIAMTGEPLRDRHVREPAPFPSNHNFHAGRLRSALTQLAEGLSALHNAGKLHRDIKPSNVLVTTDGRVVILDFGLVKELGEQDLAQTLNLVGTPAYMSPEQGAQGPVGVASDWYSVGIMLYEALTGQVPFTGGLIEILTKKQQTEPPPPGKLVRAVPEDLNDLCLDLLRRDPAARPVDREVLRRLESAAPRSRVSGAPQLPRATPFVGRESQLASLAEAFRAIQQSGAVTVLLHGSSGMGKSTLMRRFLEELRQNEPQAVLLAGRCYEQESVPYKGLDSLMDALSQYLKGLPPLEIEGIVPRDVQSLARLFPVLREVPAIARARSRVLEMPDSWELRHRGFRALRDLLARLADRHAVVLFIDDLQWGDLDSARLLEEILRPPGSPALLLVACYRSEDAEISPLIRALRQLRSNSGPAADFREVVVGEMTPLEARELALGLSREASSSRAELIARESGGVPFFVHELVRYDELAGRLDPQQTAIESGGVQKELGETALDRVIRFRFSQLSGGPQLMLQVLAVAGRPLECDVLAHAAAVDDQASALDTLRAEHLVRTRAAEDLEEIEIYHARIGESVLARLSSGALKNHHLRIARALEACNRVDPETLFVHYHQAGERARAAAYAVAAAAQASEALAFDRAARLYRHALEDQPPDESTVHTLHVRLADALANAGRGDEAARTYLSAVETGASAEKLELQQRAVEQFFRSGHFDEGLATLRTVLPELHMKWPETPRRALISLLVLRLRIRLRGLGFRERDAASIPADKLIRMDTCWSVSIGLGIVDSIRATVFQARYLLLALNAGEPFRVTRALALEASFSARKGGRQRDYTNRVFRRAMELAERSSRPDAIGLVTLGMGIACYLRGEWEQGAEIMERSEKILVEECIGAAQEAHNARIFQLRCLYWMGELNELRRRLPTLLKDAHERGDLYAATMLGLRASYVVHLSADDPARAREVVRETIERWSQQGFHAPHYIDLYVQTEIDLYSGDVMGAYRRITDGWIHLRRSLILTVQFAVIEAGHLRARAALAAAAASPDNRALLKSAERDAAILEREKMPWADPLANMIRAGVASIRGDRNAVLNLLATAETGCHGADMALCAAVARRRRGQLLGGEEGRALVEAAEAWMRNQGIANPERMTGILAPGRW